MTKPNGSTTVNETLTDSEKLDVLIEGLTDLSNEFELFKEEVFERLANLGVENSGFDIFDES